MVYRTNFDEIRQRFLSEDANAGERMIMAGLDEQKIRNEGKIEIPEELLVIHTFEQIEQPADLYMKKSHWKIIRGYLDREHPDHKQTGEEHMKEIEDFQNESYARGVRYKQEFKYLPSEAIMQVLVMKAALQEGMIWN